jgi:hypothetical protein
MPARTARHSRYGTGQRQELLVGRLDREELARDAAGTLT